MSTRSARPDGLALQTKGLTKRFGERIAIDSVDLAVARGSVFGLLGPNGAGKTTLIRTVLGLTAPTAGTVRLLGRRLPDQRAEALGRVGAIVEQPSFHGHLTGRENLRVAAAVRNPRTRERIDTVLERVGVSERAEERVASYSLGMRQRLGVARCLLADPKLLILDEPTNGLDPAGIQEFRLMLRELAEQEGRTVFLSSHLLDEVEKTCDVAAIVDRGRVVTQGSIAELAGDTRQLLIGCDDLRLASKMLAVHPLTRSVVGEGDVLRVAIEDDPETTAGSLNAALVTAGVTVFRLEPVRSTLEQRFLELTTPLGAPA